MMTRPARISYVIMAALLVLTGWLHLGTLVLTVFFGYFALQQFSFGKSRVLGAALYVIVVAAVTYGLIVFSKRAYKELPEIANNTIPAVVGFAEKKGIELPFTDYESLKAVALHEVKDQFANIRRSAGAAFLHLALLLIGLIVA